MEPIPYGDPLEGWKGIGIPPPDKCHDCGASVGNLHHPGCDMERCPVCSITKPEAAQAMCCKHCARRRRGSRG